MCLERVIRALVPLYDSFTMESAEAANRVPRGKPL
jgi:hypothetical protein